jgi:tetratricopeptide (TPR) repeat protein
VHLAAIDALPKALQDPHMYRGFVMLKGYYRLELLGDTTGAEGYFAEALTLGRRIYDPDTIASARYGLGFVAYFRERFEDARDLFEQSAADFTSLGLAGLAVESFSMVAECCLLAGDADGFRSVMITIREPGMARGVEARRVLVNVLDGLDALLGREEVACRTAFIEAIRRTEEPAAKEWPLAYAAHSMYGVALAVMSQPEEAEEHSRRAEAFLRQHGMKARLDLKPKVEHRLEDELRLARTAPPTS